eukprot:CAMPEP_0195124880 /NCGR_PEP_ID=MMETSP0448-20130528/131826_1 /TAXON_ID=66468 /ORGANISM="Heterocapsa triquestra, Strain CCMP 448" /LENGTH=53 /DNA_ID=CAMNT_0040162497 /DNA_START=136 /DNA_END=293 /DNA_ORIENTATION=-
MVPVGILTFDWAQLEVLDDARVRREANHRDEVEDEADGRKDEGEQHDGAAALG